MQGIPRLKLWCRIVDHLLLALHLQLTANADGSYKAEKLYALGRQSWELPYVMPDNRTIYGTDDGDNTMFTRFVVSLAIGTAALIMMQPELCPACCETNELEKYLTMHL